MFLSLIAAFGARVTPAQFAEKWARRTQGATQDYTAGIDRVTVAPGLAAAEQADLLVSRFLESVTSGKWAERVSAVSLGDWKNAAKTKGAPRIAQGVAGASSKMQDFGRQFLPFLDNIVAQIKAMPKTTLEDRIARSAALQRMASEFRRN